MIINHQLGYLRVFLKKELNALYVSLVLRSLAFSMVGIFIPLYLYIELGYSLKYVIYYYLIYSLVFGLLSYPNSKFMEKTSFKYIALVCSPLYIIFFILLYLLEFNPILFFFIPLLEGFADSLFWPAFHLEFSGASDYEQRAKEVANYYNFSLLSGLVGPMMGGAVLLFSGFALLFFLVGLLLLGSTVPIFFTETKKKNVNLELKKIFQEKDRRDGISFIGKGGVLIVASVFWPIFIYQILGGYLKLGSLATAVALVTVSFTFLIVKLTNKYRKHFLVKIGTFFHTIAWILKIFIETPLQLIGIYVFRSLASMASDLPFLAITYNKSHQREEYFVMMEIALCIGRVLALLLVLAFGGNILVSFALASLFSLLYLFI